VWRLAAFASRHSLISTFRLFKTSPGVKLLLLARLSADAATPRAGSTAMAAAAPQPFLRRMRGRQAGFGWLRGTWLAPPVCGPAAKSVVPPNAPAPKYSAP